MDKKIKILGFAGSLRKDSYNKSLLRAALELVPKDAELETFDLEGIPPFNQDLENRPPEKVKEFRHAILDLRKSNDFYNKIQSRMEAVYGLVLPDYGPSAAEAVQKADAVNFIIGPEKQFESYERYLHSVEGQIMLYRIYPRDYWIKLQVKKPTPGSL